MKVRQVLLGLFTLVVLGAVNWAVLQKEQVKNNGVVVLLALAPVDPRSLMQGDYMQLRYAIGEEIARETEARLGHVVVRLDEDQVAHFVRVYDGHTPLEADEILLPFHQEGYRSVRIGPDSFFFQEGHGKYYQEARYGELRTRGDGEVVLVALRGEDLERLGPP